VAPTDIEHVVVVMFENRSFDHLLGLLSDDPGYPGVKLGDDAFSNPVDPRHPEAGRVRVTDDASPRDLPVDPPHSHASVVEQMGLRPGRRSPPSMDGFVAAYARKVAGNEEGLPVVHWRRLYGAGGAVSVLVGAVLALPWFGPLVAGALGLVGVAEAGVGWAYRRRRVLPISSWRPAFVAPAVAGAAGVAVSAVLGRFLGFKARATVLAAAMGAALGRTISRQRSALSAVPAEGLTDAGRVMRCMRPSEAPVLSALASSFALCTRWHCSVPGATWPNRNFAHAGTSDGTVDIELGLYDNPTIFQRLQEAGRSWAIYRDAGSMAQVMAFGWLTDDEQIGSWRRLEEFEDDVAGGRLATYSFLEPCHDGPRSNSQHPGNNDHGRTPPAGGLTDFERGENLLVDVYEALRANPAVFAKTLLVITYDEHGGLYDHVPPPTDAIEPEPFGAPRRSWMPRLLGWIVEQPESRFRFTALGPRVPTIVVSPLVPATWDDTCYDHTAIPRTLRSLFAPEAAPLSAREAASPSFHGLASLDEPRSDLPDLSGLRKRAARAAAAAGPPPPPRDDDLARQLRALSSALRPKLERGRPPPARSRAAAAPPVAGDDVPMLLTARAEAARRR
jgi:hypothetical protein